MQNRRQFIQHLVIGTAGLAIAPRLAFGESDPWTSEYAQILARIKPPTFPKRDFVITKFGAQTGAANDSTDSMAKAIDACSKAGGGRVVVPAGEFLTGAVHLKGNVNLYL